jgi:hypothetical protein
MEADLAPTEDCPTDGMRSSKRRGWIGCGLLLLLFVAAAAVWLQDIPPIDDADLEPTPVRNPPGTVQTAVEELDRLGRAAERAESWFDDRIEAGAADPFGPTPLDPEAWSVERAVLEELIEAGGPSAPAVDAALDLPVFGVESLETFLDPIPEISGIRDLAMAIRVWGLAARLDGDLAESSRRIERGIRLADRTVNEGNTALIWMLVGIAVHRPAWEQLIALAQESIDPDGPPLDPEVEGRLLARPPAGPRLRERFAESLRHEYWTSANTICAPEHRSTVQQEVALAGPFFKPNATRALLADHFRALIEEVRLTPVERRSRPAPAPPEKTPLWQVLVQGNAGVLFLDIILPGFAGRFEQVESVALLESVGCTMVALGRYRRVHGELPPDLESLLAATPSLDALPLDPFSGEPLRYDRARRLLWSVGMDGIDAGGSSLEGVGSADEVLRLPDPVWRIGPAGS